MKRELGIARCGLACCLCSENAHCGGCSDAACPDRAWCENLRCSKARGLAGCYACTEDCRKGLLAKVKPLGFTLYARRHGTDALVDRLAALQQAGLVYHRCGVMGDYDDFADANALLAFLEGNA